jgi:uncharacterized protein
MGCARFGWLGLFPTVEVRLMQFADSPFELKSIDAAGHVEGVLAGFGNIDHGNDRLEPGCFTKTLAARSSPLPMLLHHDLKRPIGAWTEWSEADAGLRVKGRMTMSTRDAQEAHALASDGALGGLSIGWKCGRSTTDQATGVRTVHEAELFEGSLVAVPMNPTTRITSVKAITTIRDLEALFAEVGMSNRKAKAAAGAAWKAINDNDTEEKASAELAAILTRSIARLTANGVK